MLQDDMLQAAANIGQIISALWVLFFGISSIKTSSYKRFNILNLLQKKHEAWLVKRQQRLYRESLQGQKDWDSHLLLDGNAVTLRGLFYFHDLLKRQCPPRRAQYLKPLRNYRLNTLQWSDERAAREARIGLSTYKRIEGLKFKERPQTETLASICAAFGVDADQLGFDQFYPDTELVMINLRARSLRLIWSNTEAAAALPVLMKGINGNIKRG